MPIISSHHLVPKEAHKMLSVAFHGEHLLCQVPLKHVSKWYKLSKSRFQLLMLMEPVRSEIAS